MDDKFILAAVGLVCLTAYGISALILGHNGTIMTAIVGTMGTIIAGCIGYGIAKVKS